MEEKLQKQSQENEEIRELCQMKDEKSEEKDAEIEALQQGLEKFQTEIAELEKAQKEQILDLEYELEKLNMEKAGLSKENETLQKDLQNA